MNLDIFKSKPKRYNFKCFSWSMVPVDTNFARFKKKNNFAQKSCEVDFWVRKPSLYDVGARVLLLVIPPTS
jgi:hypothetical protein